MKLKCLMLFILVNISLIVSANDLLFFEGIGGEMGEDRDSFEMPMGEQLDFVIKHEDMGTKDVVIVAHSQGGLRAVALAGYLQRNDINSIKLDTIITIGAPVKGFSPLLKGVGGLRNEIRGAADLLVNGMNIAAGKVGLDPRLSVDSVLTAIGLDNGLMDLIIDQNNDAENTSIPEMHPNSKFIRDNVYSVDTKIKVAKVQFSRGQYKPLYIVEKKENYKLPKNINYGFIVGSDSDILDLAGEVDIVKEKLTVDLGFYKFTIHPKTANNLLIRGLSTAAGAYSLDEASHRFWQNIHWFKFWDHRDYRREKALGDHCARKKNELNRAANWARNYEANCSKILGTEVGGNDCFIPVKDQSIDFNKINGNAVDKLNGRFESPNLNHLNEMYSQEIWGEGGSLTNAKIGPGGKLGEWLQISEGAGTIIK